MNVLEKILEEIEEKFKTADAEKCDCEELCDVEDWYDSGYIDGQLSAHEKCMDIIRSHMDEAKDTNVGQWIPTSERLPNEEEFVQAYCRNHYCAEFIVMIEGATRPTALYYKNGIWADENNNHYRVVAWQPLPESYKGE